jgi:leader peptidase (prepilin peptidase)/N-methyltransferase
LAAAAGCVVAIGTRPALLRLREPADAAGKVPYRSLATPSFVLCCFGLSLLAEAAALTSLPLPVQPLWWVLATCGLVLAAIDARTTWLPLQLTYLTWILMAVAAAMSWLLGASGADLARTVAGAAIAGALYLGIWLVTSGGFGFGDVRFAPLLGAAAAGQSWPLLLWALTLGTLVGAAHGALRLLRKKRDGFPYAPSMLAGAYLAAVGLRLLAA